MVGFTVFGEVLSDADLIPVDSIASLPTEDQTTELDQVAFTDVPLISDPVASDDDLVRYESITVEQRQELEFDFINTSPDLLNISITDDNELVIDYLPGQTGTAELTIQATNLQGGCG